MDVLSQLWGIWSGVYPSWLAAPARDAEADAWNPVFQVPLSSDLKPSEHQLVPPPMLRADHAAHKETKRYMEVSPCRRKDLIPFILQLVFFLGSLPAYSIRELILTFNRNILFSWETGFSMNFQQEHENTIGILILSYLTPSLLLSSLIWKIMR